MNKPHKHAKVIKAWADGAQIEYSHTGEDDWREVEEPRWYEDTEYRVKVVPQPRFMNIYSGCANIWRNNEASAREDRHRALFRGISCLGVLEDKQDGSPLIFHQSS